MVTRRPLLGALLLLVAACASKSPGRDGTCVVNSALECGFPVDAGPVAAGWDLVGYSCSGTVRPDDSPTIDYDVPSGLVCANRGAGDNGNTNYCCTPTTVQCALDQAFPCQAPEVGYQCRAPTRPEMVNPEVLCHQGVYEGDLLNFCCATAETIVRQGCHEDKGAGCPDGTYRWTCPAGGRPTEEDYTNSESKADFYYLYCSNPTPAPNPAYSLVCCFSQTLPQLGGTCTQDRAVPGCAPGRFGVACYGQTDTAEEDFPVLKCDPPVEGLSAEGYPATLYCCDYAPTPP
jgi:hypothetical protein